MFSAFQTFGKLGALASSVARAWTPTTLFAAGEAGGLWDFTTLANLYQDSAGTTPCTAVGDPIGKVLDTSGRGNHLTQATSTKRPVLGRMPATGVRNLLTYSEDFSNAAWNTNGGIAKGSSTTDPLGGNTALTVTAANAYGHIFYYSGAAIGQSITNSIYVRRRTGSGPIQLSVPSNYVITISVTDEWQRFSMSGASSVSGTNGSYLVILIVTAGDAVDIAFAQIEAGSTATAYQKVGAAYDVTESGVASVYTAYFDGVDDCLVSPSIDFSGTDKMSVFAGARKVNDTAGVVAELSADTNATLGSFYFVSGTVDGQTGWQSSAHGGDVPYANQIASSTIAGPDTAVLSIAHDIPGDLSTIRRNGVAGTSGTGDKSTGNFGNYPLYVGQRGAETIPYKGFLSALCTRGAATDAALVTSMEKWLVARTPGVTLP